MCNCSGITSRLEALLRCFAQEDVHIVGVQETRSQLHGHRLLDDYHVLSAPATQKGVGGCQIWVKRVWGFDAGTFHVQHADLRILHSSAQRIVVQLHKNDLRLLLIAAHGPACASSEDTAAWWNATTNSIPASKRNWPIIALLDANARVGSVASHCIGSHGAELENDAGACMHQWLHDLDLVLPQTFDANHEGAHTTWRHSSGKEARLDYVAVSRDIFSADVHTSLAPVDLTITKQDHSSVLCAIPLHCLIATGKPTYTRVVDDSNVMRLPMPCAPWHLDVHSHAAQLQVWLKQAMPTRSQAFKRKKHLSEDTWQLIRWKKHHWMRCRQLRRSLHLCIFREIFNKWSHQDRASQDALKPWLRLSDRALALHEWRYHQLCIDVTAHVRSDDKIFYQELAQSQGDVAADEGINGL